MTNKERGINTFSYWEKVHKDKIQKFNRKYLPKSFHYDAIFEDIKNEKQQITTFADMGSGIGIYITQWAKANPSVKVDCYEFTDAAVNFINNEYKDIENIFAYKCDLLEEKINIEYDVIIFTEILEHFQKQYVHEIIEHYLKKSKIIYITVPDGNSNNGGEHISFYNRKSFDEYNVFFAKGLRHLLFYKLKGDLYES